MEYGGIFSLNYYKQLQKSLLYSMLVLHMSGRKTFLKCVYCLCVCCLLPPPNCPLLNATRPH